MAVVFDKAGKLEVTAGLVVPHALCRLGTGTGTLLYICTPRTLNHNNHDKAGLMRNCYNTGVKELQVLKSTQSGYEGFLRDEYTLLPESRERILATR